MFKQSILAAAVGLSLAAVASANTIVGWTIPSPASGTGSIFNYGAADQGDLAGSGMLSGSHALAATAWSTPAGNGSPQSLSSNNWSAGDYYQVTLATLGYTNISVSWDQTRSATGPATFDFLASVDGGATFTPISLGYTVIQAGAAGSGTSAWNSTTYQAAFTTKLLVPAAANQASVILRWASEVTTASAGTNRIDNIFITGDLVPGPGGLVLLGVAGLVARRRR